MAFTENLHKKEDNTASQNSRMHTFFTKMWKIKVAAKI